MCRLQAITDAQSPCGDVPRREGSAVPCLSCVTAHQHGRFWFCNRCGNLMSLRPVRAQGIPLVSHRNAGASVLRQQDPNRRYPRVAGARTSAMSRHPVTLGRESTAVAAETPGPEPADVAYAVVLDLDAARRLKDTARPS